MTHEPTYFLTTEIWLCVSISAQLHQVLYVTLNDHYIFKFKNSRALL